VGERCDRTGEPHHGGTGLILVCGDRKWDDKEAIKKILESYAEGAVWLINGGQTGADTIAAKEARKLKLGVITFDAPWDRLGKAAGPIRNRLMLDLKPGLVIGFHDDIYGSLGTKDCLNESSRRGYPTFIWTHEKGQVDTYRRIA